MVMETLHILIAGNEPRWMKTLQADLSEQGFTVDVVRSEEGVCARLQKEMYHSFVLQAEPSQTHALGILQRVRSQGYSGGVILIGTSASDEQKIYGLQCGADDYLVMPFTPSELGARLKALFRRVEAVKSPVGFDRLRVGELEINFPRHHVQRSGRAVRLTKTEFDLLTHFMRKPDHIFSTQTIAELLFEHPEQISTNTIAVHIKNLRCKVDGALEKPCIRTERGYGYGLDSDALLHTAGGIARSL